MKYMNYLLCLISAFCLIHQVTSPTPTTGFKLLAFGDVGQIDYWFKQSIRMKIAASFIRKPDKPQVVNHAFIDTYTKKIINEQILQENLDIPVGGIPAVALPKGVSDRQAAAAAAAAAADAAAAAEAAVKAATDRLALTTPAKFLFQNFNKIFTCDIKPLWNNVVILGDGVYTENKGGLLSASFGESYISEECSIADDLIIKTVPSTTPQATPPQATPTAPVDILVPQKRNIYFVPKSPSSGAAINISEKFNARVKYATEKLYDMFSGDTCKIPSTAIKLDILPGNHSFDVDASVEAKSNVGAGGAQTLNSAIRWRNPLWSNPTSVDGVTVNFLDINFMSLTCLDVQYKIPQRGQTAPLSDSQIYKNCILNNKAANYLLTISESKEYLYKLVAKLIESKYLNTKYDWRVIRTHNPLFNPEIDMNIFSLEVSAVCSDLANKLVKFNLEQAFTAKPAADALSNAGIIQCEEDNSSARQPKSLLEIFKLSEIDFWLASHYHAAMLVATPFGRTMFPSQYQGKFVNQANPEKCIDRFEEFFAKSAAGTAVPHPGPSTTTTIKACDDASNSNDAEKVIELMPKGPQNLLLEFIVGNSGRFLDPLKGDSLSNGDVIWGRAKAARYIDSYIDDAKNAVQTIPTQADFDAKVEEIASSAFSGYNNNFGFGYVTFAKTEAYVEFREADTTGAVTTVKKFKLIRRAAGGTTVHKIEQMLTKTIPTPDPPKPACPIVIPGDAAAAAPPAPTPAPGAAAAAAGARPPAAAAAAAVGAPAPAPGVVGAAAPAAAAKPSPATNAANAATNAANAAANANAAKPPATLVPSTNTLHKTGVKKRFIKK